MGFTGALTKVAAGFIVAGTLAFAGCGPTNPAGVGGAGGAGGGGGGNGPAINFPGPHRISSYTSGWRDSPDYGAATIWYPQGLQGPLWGVAVVPGFTELQLRGWGEFLASHGYITITIDTNDTLVPPEQRAVALKSALQTLREENTRGGSPIAGRLGERFAVMGHSMGGGGALIVGNENPANVRASVGLTPWRPGGTFGATRVPTLMIGGESDALVYPSDITRFYDSIPNGTPKTYMSFRGADHFVVNNPNLPGNAQTGGRFALAWLKIHLDGDASYRPWIQNNSAFHIFRSTL
ncbi:MAG TPA: hypothetical protein VK524_17030 [Polyangiaceae bacterium]|nr:hypothetical protein [Polyangiaceae bacterium]